MRDSARISRLCISVVTRLLATIISRLLTIFLEAQQRVAELPVLRKRISRSERHRRCQSEGSYRGGRLHNSPGVQQQRYANPPVSVQTSATLEAMIPLAELSRRRIRSAKQLVRVGRNECVSVIRVDKDKGTLSSLEPSLSIYPSHDWTGPFPAALGQSPVKMRSPAQSRTVRNLRDFVNLGPYFRHLSPNFFYTFSLIFDYFFKTFTENWTQTIACKSSRNLLAQC